MAAMKSSQNDSMDTIGRGPNELGSDNPIFIVGVGRSGTSMIQSVLATNSDLAIPPETGFVRRYLANGLITAIYRREGVRGVHRRLSQDPRLQRLGPILGQAVENASRESEALMDAVLYNELLGSYAKQNGKRRFGDKDPRSIEYLPLLAHFWPKAWIVHVIRDPRDVLASKKRALWSKDRSPFSHIFSGAVQFEMGSDLGPRLFGSRYVELYYEKFLALPHRELATLCRQLQLPFETEMLNFAEASQVLVREEEIDWKKETLGPLLTSNTGKWRSSLRDWEIVLTECVNSRMFIEGAYSRGHSELNLSHVKKGILSLVAAGLRAMIPLYKCYRLWTIRRKISDRQ